LLPFVISVGCAAALAGAFRAAARFAGLLPDVDKPFASAGALGAA
jgi:hypothetical protein